MIEIKIYGTNLYGRILNFIIFVFTVYFIENFLDVFLSFFSQISIDQLAITVVISIVITVCIAEIYTRKNPLSISIKGDEIGFRSLLKKRFYNIESITNIKRLVFLDNTMVVDLTHKSNIDPSFFISTWGVRYSVTVISEGSKTLININPTTNNISDLIKTIIS